jgi:hypothetical protein
MFGFVEPEGLPQKWSLLLNCFMHKLWPVDIISSLWRSCLTLTLLTWRIWWAPNNASRLQMGFNSAFKGLILPLDLLINLEIRWLISLNVGT